MPLKDYRSLIFWWGQRLAWPQVVLYSKFLSAGFTTPQWPSFENRMSFGSKKGVQRYTWSDVQGWWETPQKNWASLAASSRVFLQHRTFSVNLWAGDDYHSQIIRNHKDKCPLGIAGVPFGVFWKVEDEDMKSFPLGLAILIEDV